MLLSERLRRIRLRLERIPSLRRTVDVSALLLHSGDDAEFIDEAYLLLFDRKPDPAGMKDALDHLRRLRRPALLRLLTDSAEARMRGIEVAGLDTASAYHPFRIIPEEPLEDFVRALGTYYNGVEPVNDSLLRWVELMEQGFFTREDVVKLFMASAADRLQQLRQQWSREAAEARASSDHQTLAQWLLQRSDAL